MILQRTRGLRRLLALAQAGVVTASSWTLVLRGLGVEARPPEDIAVGRESDLLYPENGSLALDPGIILRTIWQMLRLPPTAV